MSQPKVRDLNDHFRRTFNGGRVMMTRNVAALDPELQAMVLSAVRTFDKFTADNDPYGEHDMAFFDVDRERYFFKIDYYDARMEYGSEDPADPSQTTRVLTIGLASDY